MIKKLPAFFLLVLLCVTVTIYAQPIRNIGPATTPEAVGFSSARLTRIDKMIEGYVKNEQLPGSVALIVRDGKIIYHKAFGLQRYGKGKQSLKG